MNRGVGRFCENMSYTDTKFSDYSPDGITSYLTFRYPIRNITMFQDIYKEETDWFPKFGGCLDSVDDAIIKIDYFLNNSIKKLIDKKKKIGIALSGGLDSSLLVAMIRRLFPARDIYTYSAGFYGDDEFEYSRFVAKENNTIHKEKTFYMDDFLGSDSILSDLIKFKGAPLHPNELPLAIIERLAKENGVDVVLCGEGADDIFGGYSQNFRMYMSYDYKESFFKFFLDNYRYFSVEDRKIVHDKYIVDDFDLVMKYIKLDELGYDIRNWAFYFTQKFHTPGLIIRGTNAMRFNRLPVGFPYIDSKLVDYVNSLPFVYKLCWKTEKKEYDISKYIIKKVAEEYLDSKIIYRPKKGFPVPFEKWFMGLDKWDLNRKIFKHNDISGYSGWKKFMLINLSKFIDIFEGDRA